MKSYKIFIIAVLGLLLLLPATTHISRRWGWQEPAFGESIIHMKATFRQALRLGEKDGDVYVDTLSNLLRPMIFACRGESKMSRRCIVAEFEQMKDIRERIPAHPLGLPASLETTWMNVVYF